MIDVEEQINETRRVVGRRVLEAGEARTVTITKRYRTTAEDLWDACTSADRIPRWFLPIAGDLRVGGRYQLEGNAGGEVLTCDPPTAFTATWEFGGQVSWIEVRVSADGDGARLELEHIAHVDDAMAQQFGPGAVGIGWDLGLLGLHLHLASGETVDPKEFEAWSASVDGRRFVTQSGEAWHDADVAAGTDAAVARGSADRCIEAYTGGGDHPE
jgi:uncharacterized protein YndB with AHSA1/START domain